MPALMMLVLVLAPMPATAGSISPLWQQASPPTAEELLERYDRAKDPAFDSTRSEDEEYVKSWEQQRNALWRQRYEAAVQLARHHPDHPRVADVLSDGMQLRYHLQSMAAVEAAGDPGDRSAWAEGRRQVRQEIASWLAEQNVSAGVRQALIYVDIRLRLLGGGMNNEKIAALLPAIEELRRSDPDGAPPRYLLFWAARISTGDQQTELLRRLAAEEAETWEGKWAAGMLRRAEAIGKPFEFAFDDLLTGRRVTSQDLKGKVLVIDFWGTWCGICLAMKPDLKAAYEKYRERGVEFIGVVLEDPVEVGSKEKVLAYLKEKKVDWPQWYQEQGWSGSDFPLSYGISGLPTVFIVDAEGMLRSMKGRPDEELDAIVTQLLAEREGVTAGE